MIVAKIKVDGVSATADYRKTITAGMIGAQVQFDYTAGLWDGLHKTVVFRGVVTKDVITDGEAVTIPVEVVAKHGYPLRVGVYGVDADGNIAIPTIWADLGTVRDAADPSGDLSTDPSLPVWAQIQAMIGNLEELETTARDNLVVAINEALKRGGGDVPVYTGDYTVTPDVAEQMLKTAQKKMTADVKIKKIPIWEVSNSSGGTTINIGKEV